MITGDREFNVGILLAKSDGSADVRPDQTVRQKHVFDAGVSKHFRFGERRALVTDDSASKLHLDNLAGLVRLAVRPQSRRVASDFDHVVQVLLNHVSKDNESR
jgi:hypothetical protein